MDGVILRFPEDAPLPVSQGNLLDFPDDPIACLQKLHRQHGPIAALEGDGTRLHFVFSPEYNHQVLSDSKTFHSRFFAVRGPRNSPQRRLSSGLLSMNGDVHKRNRRMVMDAFLKKAIQTYLPTIRELTLDMLNNWRAGEERDISREMTEFLLRLTSTILFGMDDRETAYEIGRKVDEWVHLNHELGMSVFVADPGFTARYDELLSFAGRLEADIAGMIERRRQSGGEHNVLSMILQAHDESGHLSEEELIGQAALIFAAAHLTTAHSLTWALSLLALHPAEMQSLWAELQSLSLTDFPELAQVERAPVLDRTIKESMRVLPASAYSQRIANEPARLGPFDLVRGSGVIFSQFMTHRLADLYPEAATFQPNRWQQLSPSPYAYLPFGAGPRMCLGGPLAMMILKTVVPSILQRFKLTVVPGTMIGAKVISTMLAPQYPIWMRLDEQDGRFQSSPIQGNLAELVDLPNGTKSFRRAA